MEANLSGNELRKAAKRKEIIAGAIKAFEQEGYERATMDLVSDLAGASNRTVYNYLESKKHLLWAVIGELMAGQHFEVLTIYGTLPGRSRGSFRKPLLTRPYEKSRGFWCSGIGVYPYGS
jgi:AcrR family transcriptional regulator